MKISIVEEDEMKVILEYQDVVCPYCKGVNLVTQQSFNDVCLDTKGLKEFIKKDIYIKRIRYKCKCCNKTFANNTRFPDRIFDENLKPILRLLLDKNLLKTFEINQSVSKKLNIDDKWLLLRAKKTLTIINIYTLEIKEFIGILKNKSEIKIINGKQIKFIKKEIEYRPFERKHKNRITYKRN